MKLVYKANNAREFNTELECLAYENELLLQQKIQSAKEDMRELVLNWCDCEDYEVYSAKDIADFIFLHFDKIQAVVNN